VFSAWRLQCNIAYNIMTPKRREEVRQGLEALRRRSGSIKGRELVHIALSLGRTPLNRGKEPTYVRPGWFPLSIPGHPGTLKKGTACNIINQLEEDLDRIEQEAAAEKGNGEEREQ
jgi:hypothetical protein